MFKKRVVLFFSCLFLLGIVGCGTVEDTTAPDVTTEAPETPGPLNNPTGMSPEAYIREHGWYLYEQPLFLPPESSLSEIEQAWAVKVPKTYSQRVEELEITVDFFQDAWALKDFMQVRVSILNHGEKPFVYRSDSYDAGVFLRSDGERMEFMYCKSSDIKFVTAELNWAEVKPNAQKIDMFERVYATTPTFFVPDEEYGYTFCITLTELIMSSDPDRNREPRVITVEIPVTVEKVTAE